MVWQLLCLEEKCWLNSLVLVQSVFDMDPVSGSECCGFTGCGKIFIPDSSTLEYDRKKFCSRACQGSYVFKEHEDQKRRRVSSEFFGGDFNDARGAI